MSAPSSFATQPGTVPTKVSTNLPSKPSSSGVPPAISSSTRWRAQLRQPPVLTTRVVAGSARWRAQLHPTFALVERSAVCLGLHLGWGGGGIRVLVSGGVGEGGGRKCCVDCSGALPREQCLGLQMLHGQGPQGGQHEDEGLSQIKRKQGGRGTSSTGVGHHDAGR